MIIAGETIMIKTVLILTLKKLISEVAGEVAGEFTGEVANMMLYEMFGRENLNTPSGQFLMLMNDSLCDFCSFFYSEGKAFEYDMDAYTRIKVVSLKCSSDKKLLNSILLEMLDEESYSLLDGQDIEKWYSIVDNRLPRDEYQVLYRYILNHTDKKEQLNVESVLKIVQALNTIKSEETLEEVLCNWFSEQCSGTFDSIYKDTLEVGYILTDYLEKRKNYGKSVEIANQLLKIYENEDCKCILDKEYIRKIIGCAYSLAIADVHPEDKKRELLENSEIFFAKALEMCEEYEKNKFCQYEDKKFLWGLYYSDYGAMLVNKGNYYKDRGDFTTAEGYYKRAKEAHELSLNYRLSLKEALNESELYDKNEIDNMIARTISNLGGAYFYLTRYRDSIEKQEEALKIFERQGDRVREYRTKELIVGNYILLWKDSIDLISQSDFDKCMGYLKAAKFYYEITNNKSLDGVVKKIIELENVKSKVCAR